jgi:putative Mg2+ transporter-C (MgtC) family protein
LDCDRLASPAYGDRWYRPGYGEKQKRTPCGPPHNSPAHLAPIAMIQTNLLMDANGKPGNSYVVMDLMRLPLGILTGVGFIGAGAIVRKDEFVLGITTAATIWFSTVVGLCIGGGCVSILIGFMVLSAFRPFEKK